MTDTLAACKAMAEVIWQQHAGAPVTAESDDLAAVAERFIEFKRHLGHRYASQALHIRQFVGFLHSRGIRRSGELSIDAMLGWAASRSHLTTTTWQKEVDSISVLMGHLKDLALVTNNEPSVTSRLSDRRGGRGAASPRRVHRQPFMLRPLRPSFRA